MNDLFSDEYAQSLEVLHANSTHFIWLLTIMDLYDKPRISRDWVENQLSIIHNTINKIYEEQINE